MLVGMAIPPRVGSTPSARERRNANAISMTAQQAVTVTLFGEERFLVTSPSNVYKTFFDVSHVNGGSMVFRAGGGGETVLVVDNGTNDVFRAGQNGTYWFFDAETDGSGPVSIVSSGKLYGATAGGLVWNEAYASGSVFVGDWQIYADWAGNATGNPHTINRDTSSSHTFNKGLTSLEIDEDYGAILKVYNGTFKWLCYKLAPYRAGGGESFKGAVDLYISDQTLSADNYSALVNASTGNRTITLPAAASHTGRVFCIKKTDSSSNTVTIDGNGSETIDGATTYVLGSQYDSVMIQSDGSNWHIMCSHP